jgi:hypothetical protein
MKFHFVYRVFESEQQRLDSFTTSIATSILSCSDVNYAKLSRIEIRPIIEVLVGAI